MYFANYIYLNVQNGSMSPEMEKLADYIEFGTRNQKTIEMQKFGFSRELSLYIQRKHNDCLTFSLGELDNIDFEKVYLLRFTRTCGNYCLFLLKHTPLSNCLPSSNHQYQRMILQVQPLFVRCRFYNQLRR